MTFLSDFTRWTQDALPDAHRMIYHEALCFALTGEKFSPFVYLMPQSKWVNLGFYHGAGLPDPMKLLVGEGKRMRNVKIRSEEDALNPALKPLLKAAWKRRI